MTFRRRLLVYYCATVFVSLMIVAFWSWFEFREQRNVIVEKGVEAALRESPLLESAEIMLFGGVSAALVGISIGVVLMGRALRPIENLTESLEKTNLENLQDPVPRSGNGDELDRMTVVFNGMKRRLGASITQAREFTLHASHELKTPLAIMHSTLEQMLEEPAVGESQRNRIASVIEEVQRLSKIVGQLEFLAKADAGELTLQRELLSLDEHVREVFEDTGMLAGPAGISVKLGKCEPARVMGDRMRMRQLLLILADNAVKFNHEGGEIDISLQCEGECAVVRVINTGPVVPEGVRSRVFERFFRWETRRAGSEGSGLGLCIAASIARAKGGTLVMEVTKEGRTCMILSLPLLNEEKKKPERASIPALLERDLPAWEI